MSRLGDLLRVPHPGEVRRVAIGDFAECSAGATPASGVAAYWDGGSIPWMSSGEVNKGTVFATDKTITQAGYDSCSTKMLPPNVVVMALAGQGKTRGLVARTRIALCTNQSLAAIVPDETVDTDYLYYYLQTQYQQLRAVSSGDGTRGGLNLQMIKAYTVPVPPLEVQREIVRILDGYAPLVTDLEAELKIESAARQKQFLTVRSALLSFENVQVARSTLGELATVRTGQAPSPGALNAGGSFPFVNAGTSASGYVASSNTPGDTVTIPSRGQGGVGIAGYQPDEFWCGPLCYRIRSTSDDLMNRYLFHYLSGAQSEIRGLQQTGGTPALNRKELVLVEVPVPDIAEQRRVVEILDRFTALTSNLVAELRIEEGLRRKQYEYHREQLLTFQELAA